MKAPQLIQVSDLPPELQIDAARLAEELTAAKKDTAVKRRPFRYMGGKDRIAGDIIRRMPVHAVYTEAFGGGGSVLLQKPRAATEVYNDLCGEVVNAFRQLRDNGPELERRMRLTPFSRAEYEAAYEATRGQAPENL